MKNQGNPDGSDNADSPYTPPNNSKLPENGETGEGRVIDKSAWKVKRQGKNAEDASSGSEASEEPSRYKGFRKAFDKNHSEKSKAASE